MSTTFDPYHRWLAIPPEDQPPHHYRLLGLKQFESDPDVIENAAEQRMVHLRACQSGRHAELSQKLLNEVSAARATLLDSRKKAEYDVQLRTKLAAEAPRTKPAPSKPLPKAIPLESAAPAIAPIDKELPGIVAARTTPQAAAGMSAGVFLGAGAIALVAMACVGAYFLSRPSAPSPVAQGGANAPPPLGAPRVPTALPTPPNPAPVVPPAMVPGNSIPPNSAPFEGHEGVAVPAPSPTLPGPEVRPEPPTIVVNVPPAASAVDPGAALPKKHPVPDKSLRDQKRTEIAAIFSVEEATTAEERERLATELVRTARATLDDPPARFVLLNLAREQAAAAGRARLAFQAIDALEEQFEFDAAAVRVATIDQAAGSTIPTAAKRDIADLGRELAENLATHDDFDRAIAVNVRVLAVARALREAELIKALVDQRRALDAQAIEFGQAQKALSKLTDDPDDAEANLVAGRYLAFVKREWSAGLPHLAKGSDAALAAAARADLASPQAADDVVLLADAWWTAGDAQSKLAAKQLCHARAGGLYRKVSGQVGGLTKVRVDRRIEESRALLAAASPAPSTPAPAGGSAASPPEMPPNNPPGVAAVPPIRPNLPVVETGVYLDDVPEIAVQLQAGKLGKYGDTGGLGNGWTFEGERPKHALSMHAGGVPYVMYRLDGRFHTFAATAALWEDPRFPGSRAASALTFKVLGDGKLLWESAAMQNHGQSERCRVDIRGIRVLRLEIHDAGNPSGGRAVWAYPRLIL